MRAVCSNGLGFSWVVFLGALACSSGAGAGAHGSDASAGGSSANGGTSVGGTTAGGSGATTGGTSNGTTGGSTTGGSTSGGSDAGGTTSGGSASGGSGGTLPHTVLDCDGLGAVDEFEDITPPGTEGVMSIDVDPLNAGTLYAGTDSSGIFKTTNCGADWVKINTGTNGPGMDQGMNWYLRVKPDEPSVIYASSFWGESLGLMKSTNAGVDWASTVAPGGMIDQNVEYGGFFQWASLDPTNSEHMVVTFHANCLNEYSGGCIGESTDGGETWTLPPSPYSGWAEAAGPIVLGPTTFLYLSGHMDSGALLYTSDSGETWENVGSGAHGQMYVRQDGTHFLGGYGILTSPDGHTWTKVEGSPECSPLIGDGTRLFCGTSNAEGEQAFSWTPEDDPGTWTKLTSPAFTHPTAFALDPDHHVLYASGWEDGLVRMVTE